MKDMNTLTTKEKVLEEFREKFTDENNRGIVHFQDDPVWKGFCENCDKKFEGKEEIEKIRFGHKDCPVRNKFPYVYFQNNIKVKDLESFLSSKIDEIEREKVTEDTSDGYHTFKELYEFRKLYNAALFNEWAKQGKYNIHKSIRHHDGELCFGGGWFIVMADLPTGQISNHYEMKDWDLFQCEEREHAEEWDGHTAQDVAKRLNEFLSHPKDSPVEGKEKDVK